MSNYEEKIINVYWVLIYKQYSIFMNLYKFILHIGSSDFFGINHYTTKLVEDSPLMDAGESYSKDLGVRESFDPTWDG